jgi:hypothetical protein
MADYTPVYTGDIAPFTVTASAAVVGGTLVETSTTGNVATAGAASVKVVGVAAHDAATGQRLSVWPLPGLMHEIVHTAGGTVGDVMTAAANGLMASTAAGTAAAAGTDLGVAVTTAGAAAKIRFIGR